MDNNFGYITNLSFSIIDVVYSNNDRQNLGVGDQTEMCSSEKNVITFNKIIFKMCKQNDTKILPVLRLVFQSDACAMYISAKITGTHNVL